LQLGNTPLQNVVKAVEKRLFRVASDIWSHYGRSIQWALRKWGAFCEQTFWMGTRVSDVDGEHWLGTRCRHGSQGATHCTGGGD
jgi:hypothetical protein